MSAHGPRFTYVGKDGKRRWVCLCGKEHRTQAERRNCA